MRTPTTKLLSAFVAVIATLFLGLTTATTASAHPTTLYAVPSATAAIPSCDLSSLPPEASDTLDLIHSGGPFPYDQDGTVFQNREGILPSESTGYYHEYTVKTPGSPDRGAQPADRRRRAHHTAVRLLHRRPLRLLLRGRRAELTEFTGDVRHPERGARAVRADLVTVRVPPRTADPGGSALGTGQALLDRAGGQHR